MKSKANKRHNKKIDGEKNYTQYPIVVPSTTCVLKKPSPHGTHYVLISIYQ